MRSVTASAPGRVNLIGEHLDYNGGLCLPIAIDRRTTATVRRASRATRTSTEDVAGWTAYVDGVLAALEVDDPLDVAISSEVPVGAGLSSSAALTCSVAVATNALLGLGLSPEALAEAAVAAETVHVGVPTGGLDQAAALFADDGAALLLDFDAGTRLATPWKPEDAGLRVLVVDTGVRHRLAESAYAERRATCEAAAAVLGLPFLARARADRIGTLEATAQRRARHVVTEQRRVRDLVEAAQQGAWADVGALMTASHTSLRDDFAVSCAELDAVVEHALSTGALGARMTGGGFGGAAVLLVPDDFVWNYDEAPTAFAVRASRGAAVDQVT